MAVAVRYPDLVDQTYEPRIVKPHLSFSQISMYLRCSWQYRFRYVLGIKERPKLPMAIGKGGHNALEYNARFKMRTGSDLLVPDMLDLASTFIDLEVDEVEDTPAEKGNSKDRALAALRIYQTRDAAKVTPAGVEVEFNLDLNEPNEEPLRIINGRIDLITTAHWVTDYKFIRPGGRAKTQPDVDLSPQLTLYAKVFKTLTGLVPRQLAFQMFMPGSTRTPPDAITIARDPALMTPQAQESRFARLAYQFRSVERAIAAGVFIPTDDPKTCSWCGYRERCQASLVDDFEAARIRGAA